MYNGTDFSIDYITLLFHSYLPIKDDLGEEINENFTFFVINYYKLMSTAKKTLQLRKPSYGRQSSLLEIQEIREYFHTLCWSKIRSNASMENIIQNKEFKKASIYNILNEKKEYQTEADCLQKAYQLAIIENIIYDYLEFIEKTNNYFDDKKNINKEEYINYILKKQNDLIFSLSDSIALNQLRKNGYMISKTKKEQILDYIAKRKSIKNWKDFEIIKKANNYNHVESMLCKYNHKYISLYSKQYNKEYKKSRKYNI